MGLLDDYVPDRKIHVKSRCHTFLGFTWWVSYVDSAHGMDLYGFRNFWSRDVERSEARAVAHYKRYRQKQADVRKRSFE